MAPVFGFVTTIDAALAVRDEVVGELLDLGVEGQLHRGTLGLVAQEELADPVQELLVRAARELLVHRALQPGHAEAPGEVPVIPAYSSGWV